MVPGAARPLLKTPRAAFPAPLSGRECCRNDEDCSMASGSLWLGRAVALAVVALASSVPALAETAGGAAHDVAQGVAHEAAEHAKGGLPQLNPETYPTQIFWLVVSFAFLLWIMSKMALPRVAEVLEARQEKITNDLEKASALKAETDSVILALERALEDARLGAQKVIAEATAANDKAAADRQAALNATLVERTREAESRIQAAKQAALANIRDVAAETAQAAVAKLAGLQLDSSQAAGAVDEALKERA